MANFGAGKTPRPNRRLVGDGLRLPSGAIPKIGRTVTLTWPGIASALLTRPSPTRAVIEAGGVVISIELREWPMPTVQFRQRGVRTRFVCPKCDASRDALHWINGEWGCRGKNCLDLAYACRHRQRYLPAIARRERLLRRLARVPPQGLQARMLREMIAEQEAAMLAHLQRVNRDLVKRRQRYARRVGVNQ